MSASDETAASEHDLPPAHASRGIFRHRDFALFFSAAAISNGGSWMQLVAVQALLFDLTDSGTWLGLSTVATLVPALLITPYAGVLADRVSRQMILQVTQILQMLTALALWVLYVSDMVSPGWIVTIGFINGVAAGFQTATWSSFVPLLVPEEHMLQAVRLNSVQYTMARAIGPAFGGLVVKLGGIGAAIMCNAVTYLLVIGVLVIVHPRVNATNAREQKIFAGLVQGARYIWHRRALRIAVFLALAASTFGQSLQYIASALSERLFHHSSDGNAGLLTALGAGSFVSSIVAIKLSDRLRRSVQAITALSLFAVAIAVLPLTHSYVVGQVAYFVAGMGHLQIAVALNTLIQGAVPDEYRGRALSFYLLGVLAGIPIGTQVLGAVGDAIGFRPAMALDASAFVVIVALLVITGRGRDLDATPEEVEASAAPRLRGGASTLAPS